MFTNKATRVNIIKFSIHDYKELTKESCFIKDQTQKLK